jgi:alpha-glucosidase
MTGVRTLLGKMSGPTWWRDGVLYQIYVRSFADSNGDGVGDLQGVLDHLDHLEWLGVDGVWLSPTMPSPNLDWGYDVSEYRDVHPDLGDLTTLDRLVAEAGSRGIRILLDLVPNHTSNQHPWFVEALTSREAAHRDWYVWADSRQDGSPPNNWVSVFGGAAWEFDPSSEQYFLHNFLAEQPDLNWWKEEVRQEFEGILRFWLDRGIAGFRIDVAHGLVKDRALRDDPPATDDDLPDVRRVGQRPVHKMNRPEVHDIYRRWRAVADSYDPPGILVGETCVAGLDRLAGFYGAFDDELHLCFNFPFIFADFHAEALRKVVEETEAAFPSSAWPVWTASNHDLGRFPTRWCEGREGGTRSALMALLTLRGTPFLYYGDEIGMTNVPVSGGEVRDTVGLRLSLEAGRDPGRTPMQWNAGRGAGFTEDGVRSWLPIGDAGSRNVADQRSDRGSTLHLCRDLIALRRRMPELRSGAYRSLPSPPGAWAWRRGTKTLVAVNLSDQVVAIGLEPATILMATDRRRDGEHVQRELTLGPWQGAVLRVSD